ncbi:hypothetical protein vBPpSSYP_134 [Pseudomonas phage vB_PpS_SYP]|nr:hypothetical protein vBPpSSYP_134 [Pseudomonas phage vB_PpS_SYP]
MAWYRTGTVAVTLNSATVTGTGTSFSSNARVGDGFLGPDGRWYEVTNIASATVISITPNYLGATATGQSYSIAPLQGYVKQSADSLRTITNQYGTTLGLLGTPTDTAGLRSNIGAAKSGANNDITSIAGLTTALSVSQGGTGGTTAIAARTNLNAVGVGDYGVGGVNYPPAGVRLDSLDKNSLIASTDNNPPDWSVNGGGGTFPMGISLYRSSLVASQLVMTYGSRSIGAGVYWRANTSTGWNAWDKLIGRADLLGTVSQTSGVPTGAVIERGSNTNGEYIRFADGTQICWMSISVTDQAISNAYGTLFQGVRTWNFPMPFSAAPTTTPGAFRWGSSASWAGVASAGTGSSVSLRGFDISSRAAGTSTDISAIAIGRWF